MSALYVGILSSILRSSLLDEFKGNVGGEYDRFLVEKKERVVNMRRFHRARQNGRPQYTGRA